MTVAESPRLTSEGSQEIKPRSELGAAELLREVGSVLRMSEAEVAALNVSDGSDDETAYWERFTSAVGLVLKNS